LGRLAKIDPVALLVAKEYQLPGGPNGGPYAVNADGAGRIWVCEVQADNVIMLNPRSDTIREFKLPTRDSGVRNAVIDADGRYWYIGSISGKLGSID
jgi:streptogramin lyase